MSFIHESAFVDQPSAIGTGTKVWHFCHIMANSIIGTNCSLGQNTFVAEKVKIGNNVKIQNNVSIYEGVELKNDVFVGPSVVFTNVINPRSSVERKNEYKKTIIGKGATLGANCTIVCGNQIGKYAMIGAGAVVTKDVPDFAKMVGNPAKRIGWIDKRGNILEFDHNGIAFSSEKEKYQIINQKCACLSHE